LLNIAEIVLQKIVSHCVHFIGIWGAIEKYFGRAAAGEPRLVGETAIAPDYQYFIKQVVTFMMQWIQDNIQKQFSRIGQLLIEPVEPQNEVQLFTAKVIGILENIISLLCFLTLMILSIIFTLQKFFPGLLLWFMRTDEIHYMWKIRLMGLMLVVALFLIGQLLAIALFIKSYYLGSLLGSIFFLFVLVSIFRDVFIGVPPSEIFQKYIEEILRTSIGS
jgi:hypothetical protein